MKSKFPVAPTGIAAGPKGYDMDEIMRERNSATLKKRFAKALKKLAPVTSDAHPYAEAAKPRGK